MKTYAKTSVIITALLAGGCTAGMEGKWSVSNVDPTAARQDMAFHSLTLQEDGTFYAQANDDGVRSVSGIWTMKEGVLNLKENDGECHTFDAQLVRGTNQMKLIRHWNGQRLVATLKRADS